MKILVVFLGLGVIAVFLFAPNTDTPTSVERVIDELTQSNNASDDTGIPHPFTIASMRTRDYPGSSISIEQSLPDGSNYRRFIASYQSDGLTINGLLTIPEGEPPPGGFAAIVFNHGWISPDEYRTTERYVAYVDALARAGFVVYKVDYRGHADSEGVASGAYFSPGYTADVLNAVSSLKNPITVDGREFRVNPNRIGMWGHSMGGYLTLRAMVIRDEIAAGSIWGGVVTGYDRLIAAWQGRGARTGWQPVVLDRRGRRPLFVDIIAQAQASQQEKAFLDAISPIRFVSDVSGPIQLHHGLADSSVPWEFSQDLADALAQVEKPHEFYTYEGGDHNLSDPHFTTAMQRTVAFFTKHL